MSGIAGFVSYEEDVRERQSIGEAMARVLSPRGPDEGGRWADEAAMLVHRRLIVAGLEGGKQPISTPNGNFILLYDGELYNIGEIRAALAALGRDLTDCSDAEALLHAFAEWGAQGCLSRLHGAFAFALWDKRTRTLTLARDRLGVKPLFYSRTKDGLVFGSALKALLRHPAVRPRLDADGLRALLLLGPLRAPGDGIFQNVREILPGHWAELTPDSFAERAYWRLEAREHPDNEAQTLERTRRLVEDAVRRRLVSDMPPCAFLSGGLGCSIVSVLAAREYEARGLGPLHTWSVCCREEGEYNIDSILDSNQTDEYNNLLKKACSAQHHSVVLEPEALARALLPATDARDLPGMADADASLLLLCARVKQQFTAALSGAGAGALFGGEPCMPFLEKSARTQRLSLLREGVVTDAEEYLEACRADCGTAARPDGEADEEARTRARFLQTLRWHFTALLDRADRMGMYSGLEVRLPFCDSRLVEYAYTMPRRFKGPGENGVLWRAFASDLPAEHISRKRCACSTCTSSIFAGLTAGYVRQIFRDERSLVSALFDHAAVEALMEDADLSTGPFRAPQIFAYLVQLERWFKKYRVELV